MKIETININDLTPYENNPRVHEDKDLKTIIASIEEFGFNDPVGVWGENNLIVEGHGRYSAAKALGYKELPCIRLDHLSEEERRAYMIAHNSTAELSGWSFNVLDEELAKLVEDIDMAKFGFDLPEFIDDDLEGLFEDPEDEAEPKMVQCPECGEWFEV